MTFSRLVPLVALLLAAPAVAVAADPKVEAAEHRALTEEHRFRAEPFAAVQGEVKNLLASARKCVPEVVEKSFGANALPSVADCAPVPASYSDMRRQLDACFAARYRDLDNLIVRMKGIAAMASVRALGDGCAFNKELAGFAGRYDALEAAMKPVNGEALVLIDKLGECAAEATRLLKVPPIAIEDIPTRRSFEERTLLLRRVAEVSIALDLQEPLKAWTDCREALAFSRELLSRVGMVTIPGATTTRPVKEPRAGEKRRPRTGARTAQVFLGGTRTEDAMRKATRRLIGLGAEISFAEEYVKSLSSRELTSEALAGLQRAAGRCEPMAQSLLEEATQKLSCYLDSLETALSASKDGSTNLDRVKRVIGRFRTALTRD